MKQRGTVILGRYASIPVGHINPDDPRWGSAVIGVPIFWDGGIIGTFAIFSDGPGRIFSAADAALVELFANHAAIAIMNSHLHQAAAAKECEAAVATERERGAGSPRNHRPLARLPPAAPRPRRQGHTGWIAVHSAHRLCPGPRP